MTDLKWNRTRDGYESGKYRIRRVTGAALGNWQLETDVPRQPAAVITLAVCAGLMEAQLRAELAERNRITRIRLIGRTGLGVAALLVLLGVYPHSHNLLGFTVAMFALVTVVHCAVAIGSVLLGDRWSWNRYVNGLVRPAVFDEFVLAMEARRRSPLEAAEPPLIVTGPPPTDPI